MAVDAWVEVDVQIDTGLAAVGSLVSVIVPDDLPGEILVGDPAVIAPGKVRLRFCNNSLYPSRPREFLVQIQPYEKREPLFSDLTFDLPEMI